MGKGDSLTPKQAAVMAQIVAILLENDESPDEKPKRKTQRKGNGSDSNNQSN